MHRYVVWTLAWEVCCWVALTGAYLFEKHNEQMYSNAVFPSATVRLSWICQFGIAVKYVESLASHHVYGHSFPNDAYLWSMIGAVCLLTPLMVRGLFISPILPANVRENATPEDVAPLLSILTFGWLSDMFKVGYKRPLEMTDLNYLNVNDRCQPLLERFYQSWFRIYTPVRADSLQGTHTHYDVFIGNMEFVFAFVLCE